jgi:LPLT family lysophospholipid transporter-like MFS transporter
MAFCLIGALAGGTLADWSVHGTLIIVASCFALAGLASLLIPKLKPEHPLEHFSIPVMLREFVEVVRSLFGVSDAQFALVGTSLFWGAGATLRFLLVAWVPIALGISNIRMPAYLNAMVAIGIVLGAGLAAKFVTVEKADRALPAGVMIGIAVCLMSGTTSVPAAFAVMAVIGCCGGFFVVPLNALIQEKGHETVGAGHAIAVQNLGENITMLIMIGVYTLADRAGMPIADLAASFGGLLAILIAGVWLHRAQYVRRMARG